MLQINTFQYNPEDMACDQCAKYGGKERGCTAQACPWLAKRIEAGVVGYEEAVRETFDYRGADLFGQRATLLYDDFDQSDAAQVLAERRYELWLLEDMSLMAVSCVSLDCGDGEYVTEYREVKTGIPWETEMYLDLEELSSKLLGMCCLQCESDDPVYEL